MSKNNKVTLSTFFLFFVVFSACDASSENHTQTVTPRDQELITAVTQKDKEAVRTLLAKGANPNVQYSYSSLDIDTPKTYWMPLLFQALGWKHIGGGCLSAMQGERKRIVPCDLEIVKMLLDAGANPNAGREEGMPILSFAARQSSPEAVRLLLDYHASITTVSGMPFLIEAAGNFRNKNILLLLERGAEVDVRDNSGQTALFVVASHSPWRKTDAPAQIALVTELLRRKADVNIPDSVTGSTALMWAAYNHNVEVVSLLLRHGAKVNVAAQRYGTALLMACKHSHGDPIRQIETVRMLLNNGANVKAVNNEGKTALMLAKKSGKTELVTLIQKALKK
jgi:ankyrin repeat protein